MPFLVEDMLAAAGGVYTKAADWQPRVVTDGTLSPRGSASTPGQPGHRYLHNPTVTALRRIDWARGEKLNYEILFPDDARLCEEALRRLLLSAGPPHLGLARNEAAACIVSAGGSWGLRDAGALVEFLDAGPDVTDAELLSDRNRYRHRLDGPACQHSTYTGKIVASAPQN